MADRFTDRRREKEAATDDRKRFALIRKQMPYLIDEMKQDLSMLENISVREFVILPNAGLTFNHDRRRFEYYADKHSDLENQVQLLADSGYVRDVSSGSHPIYRMSDQLVSLIKQTYSPARQPPLLAESVSRR